MPKAPWILAGIFCLAALPVRAQEGCQDFKWDVAKEHALFAGSALPVQAGDKEATTATLVPDHLYRIALKPVGAVQFVQTPRKAPPGDTLAGLVKLNVPKPGSYRISLELPIWVDLATEGKLVAPVDYQEQRSCDAPHKIVVYELVGPKSYLLQLSGTHGNAVRLSVTSVPGRLR
jgi:hypothetical protein